MRFIEEALDLWGPQAPRYKLSIRRVKVPDAQRAVATSRKEQA